MTTRAAAHDEPDPGSAPPFRPSDTQRAGPERTRWSGVAALALAMLVVTSEMSLAGVVIPRIGAELDAAPAVAAWVLLAYALPMAAVSIPAGRWIDGADPRAALLLSMTAVAATSVLAALAPTIWLLLLARLLQGLAASLTLSGYLPLIAVTVRPAQRGRAVSLVVTIMTVGGMAGASAGGLVAAEFGWRAVMLLKLPLVAAVLWLAARVMPRTKRGLPRPGASTMVEALLLGGGVATLLLAVENIAETPALAAALAAVAVGAGLVWSRGTAARPVLRLLGTPAFGGTVAGLFLLCFNSAVLVFLLPYLVTDVLGLGPEVTGLLLLVNIGAVSVTSPLGGWLVDRYPATTVTAAGGVLTAASTIPLLTVDADTSPSGIAWRLAVAGAAFGLFNTPAIAALMAATPSGQTGTAGGISGTVRMLSQTVAPAVAALCWTLAGGGVAGFEAGTGTILGIQAAGAAALLAAARRRRRGR